MKGLLDRLVDNLDVEVEHGPDTGGHRWAEVGYMVDFVFMETDRPYEVYLDLVGGDNALDQFGSVDP